MNKGRNKTFFILKNCTIYEFNEKNIYLRAYKAIVMSGGLLQTTDKNKL